MSGVGVSFVLNNNYIETIEDTNIFEKRIEKELEEEWAFHRIGNNNIYECNGMDNIWGLSHWFEKKYGEFPKSIFNEIKFYLY